MLRLAVAICLSLATPAIAQVQAPLPDCPDGSCAQTDDSPKEPPVRAVSPPAGRLRATRLTGENVSCATATPGSGGRTAWGPVALVLTLAYWRMRTVAIARRTGS